MFGSNSGVFNTPKTIERSTDVVFVADLFLEDYIGGAELTTAALIKSAVDGLKIQKIHSHEVTIETLESGSNKFWVFCNFSNLNQQLIPTIVGNINYNIVEYDYKFCRYRSIEKHENAEESVCDCKDSQNGKLISAFFHGAETVFYMSEKQKEIYENQFPFFKKEEGAKHMVLSSVFDDEFFVLVKTLKEKYKDVERSGWLVLGSSSWIKGTDDAIKWCNDEGKEFKVIQSLPYETVLEEMATAEGVVYLPKGGDTCPRWVIEAQMFGCKLHLNDNVQHHSEFPFSADNIEDIEVYLYTRKDFFWETVKSDMNWFPKISGYTTTYNCIEGEYPFVECIKSMVGFCNEIVIMDGGSNDGTFEKLLELQDKEPKIRVFQHKVDYNHPRFAVEDGAQKARARSKCTQPFCWQMDSDEIVHETHHQSIFKICRQFPKMLDLLALPVIEYWGDEERVRIDVNPWKWRLSRNKKYITHGIPSVLRRFDDDGNLYAAPGTDGCDYIHNETYEVIPHGTFYTEHVHQVRLSALSGNKDLLENYEKWFNNLVKNMPAVFHYSWHDLERKIKTYKNYWSQHWQSMYNIKQEDTVENNMFFNKTWSEVTDKDIKKMAKKLKSKMGGWVFHTKIDFTKKTPYINVTLDQPKWMKNG